MKLVAHDGFRNHCEVTVACRFESDKGYKWGIDGTGRHVRLKSVCREA